MGFIIEGNGEDKNQDKAGEYSVFPESKQEFTLQQFERSAKELKYKLVVYSVLAVGIVIWIFVR